MGSPAHALWIGGPPGSGKTTVALALARRHGRRWYGADTRTWEHRDRALAAGNLAAARFEAATVAERWEQATADEMLAMSLHAERGAMIADDVAHLPRSPLVVAEGTPLAPRLVTAGVIDSERSVWLLPTADVQEAHLSARRLPRGPARLYRLLGEKIEREAREHNVQIVTADPSAGMAAVIAAVESLFAATLAAGPHASNTRERQALLREANEAVIAQVRAYHARPWATGESESATRTFVCECGDPSCDADVEARLLEAARAPLLARGHG